MLNRVELKEFIKNKGMTKRHLALKVGITEHALGSILKEKRKCTINEYVWICRALEVPFDMFLTEEQQTA